MGILIGLGLFGLGGLFLWFCGEIRKKEKWVRLCDPHYIYYSTGSGGL